jgi:hypothetical protein
MVIKHRKALKNMQGKTCFRQGKNFITRKISF